MISPFQNKNMDKVVVIIFLLLIKIYPQNSSDVESFRHIFNRIPNKEIPFGNLDSVVRKVDTSASLSGIEFEVMQLNKLEVPYGDHYKEIPLFRIKLSDDFLSLVLLQYYESESFAVNLR